MRRTISIQTTEIQGEKEVNGEKTKQKTERLEVYPLHLD